MIGRINSTYQVGRMNQFVKRKAEGGIIPTDIAGCKLWLDFADADTLFTDAGSTKVTTDGDLLYQVSDKSGNGYHAVQVTSALRPQYKTSIQNGLSAGYADTANSRYMGHSYPLGAATDFTILAVYKYQSLGNYYGVFGSDWDSYVLHTSADGTSYAGVNSTSRIVTVANYIVANTNYISTLKKEGSSAGNIRLYKNGGGVLVNTGKIAPTPVSNNGGTIFSYRRATSGHAMQGWIYEYIIYNTALSDDDRSKVETYLNNKWNIY